MRRVADDAQGLEARLQAGDGAQEAHREQMTNTRLRLPDQEHVLANGAAKFQGERVYGACPRGWPGASRACFDDRAQDESQECRSSSEQVRQEVVEHEDAHGRRHHAGVDRAADADGAAPHREAKAAADDADEQAKHGGLGEAVEEVGHQSRTR
jgi:hypothetical protein